MKLGERAAPAVNLGDHPLAVFAGIHGVHDAADNGHAIHAGASQCVRVIHRDITDGNHGQPGRLHQRRVALQADLRA